MQVFKTFFLVSKKYFVTMLAFLGIGIFLTLMIAAQYSDSEKESAFGEAQSPVLVADEDASALSGAIVEFLSRHRSVSTERYGGDQIKDMLYYQEIAAYLVIPEGFEERFLTEGPLRIESESDDGQAVGSLINLQLDAYLSGIRQFSDSGLELSEAAQAAGEAFDTDIFVTRSSTGEGQTEGKLYHLLLFLPYALISVILSGILPTVLSFQEKEKRDRTNVSAVSAQSRQLSLILGGAVLSLAVWFVIALIASVSVADQVFTRKWAYAELNLLVFAIVTAMILALVSSIPNVSGTQTMLFTNLIGLSFSFLGGIFVPLSMLGEGVKAVGRFLPTYWYATALADIDAGRELSVIAGSLGRQLLFGAACLLAALLLTLRKKEK